MTGVMKGNIVNEHLRYDPTTNIIAPPKLGRIF